MVMFTVSSLVYVCEETVGISGMRDDWTVSHRSNLNCHCAEFLILKRLERTAFDLLCKWQHSASRCRCRTILAHVHQSQSVVDQTRSSMHHTHDHNSIYLSYRHVDTSREHLSIHFHRDLNFLLYHSQTLPPGHCCWLDGCHVDDQTSVLNSLVNIFARLRHSKTQCTTDSTVNGPSDASHQYHQGCQKRFDVWAFDQAYRVPGGLADDQRTGVEAYPCSEQTSLYSSLKVIVSSLEDVST